MSRRPVRRGILGAMAALTVAPATVAAASSAAAINPDADLFAACRRYEAAGAEEMRLSRIYTLATGEEEQAADAAWSASDRAVDEALASLMAIGPQTTAGLLAKTRCVWDYWERNKQFIETTAAGPVEHAAFRVLRDCALLTLPMGIDA